jgi:uncharacterized membrane protein YraQ (UPF0718 family)
MSADLIERLARLARNATATLRVRSALNPFLWACPVVGTVCFTAAYAFRADRTIALMLAIAGVVPVGLLGVAGLFLVFFRTDKLQSEEWQLRQQTLKIIEQKGGTIRISPTVLEHVIAPVPGDQIPPHGTDHAEGTP